jgi:hypothetical protein
MGKLAIMETRLTIKDLEELIRKERVEIIAAAKVGNYKGADYHIERHLEYLDMYRLMLKTEE